MFNSRAGVIADWTAVFARAAETGVAIELDHRARAAGGHSCTSHHQLLARCRNTALGENFSPLDNV